MDGWMDGWMDGGTERTNERTNIGPPPARSPTYLPTHPPTHPPTYLPTYQPTNLHLLHFFPHTFSKWRYNSHAMIHILLKVYGSVAFFIFFKGYSQSCTTRTAISRTFPSPQKETPPTPPPSRPRLPPPPQPHPDPHPGSLHHSPPTASDLFAPSL